MHVLVSGGYFDLHFCGRQTLAGRGFHRRILAVFFQAVIDEFEQRLEETHTKGVADDAVVQKASKASQAAKTAKGAKATKTPGTVHMSLSLTLFRDAVETLRL
jgi:hypothetical protein